MSLVREIFTMRPGESRRRRLPTLARRALLTGAAVLVASVCSVNAGQAAFTASASQHVVKQAGCTPGLCRPGVLAAGAYTVSNFIPGMTVSVPGGGWSSSEDSTGEFNLHPPGHALDATIFFWLDPHPVTYNDGPVAGVAGTPAGILHWLRHNRNVVLSRQTRRVVAGNISALSVDLNVPKSAPKADPACLAACIDYFYFRGGGFQFGYGTGFHEPVRLYLARIGSARTRHTLTISIDTPSHAVFESLTAMASNVLATLRLPAALPPGPR